MNRHFEFLARLTSIRLTSILLKRPNPIMLKGESWVWMSIAMFAFCFTFTPQAKCDSLFAVTVPTVTFTGSSVCGPSQNAPCVEAFSAFFEWDNTTMSVVPGTATITATGPLGNFSFYQSIFTPSAPGGGVWAFVYWANPALDMLSAGFDLPSSGLTPGIYPIVGPFQPGNGSAGLGCNVIDACGSYFIIGNSTTFFAPNPIVVTALPAVPEPSSILLFGTGVVALTGLVRRKFIG